MAFPSVSNEVDTAFWRANVMNSFADLLALKPELFLEAQRWHSSTPALTPQQGWVEGMQPVADIIVSAANNAELPFTAEGRSPLNNKNSSGPNTEPWGTLKKSVGWLSELGQLLLKSVDQ